jgi:hypothetical protein
MLSIVRIGWKQTFVKKRQLSLFVEKCRPTPFADSVVFKSKQKLDQSGHPEASF